MDGQASRSAFLACDWAANRLQTATVVPKFVQGIIAGHTEEANVRSPTTPSDRFCRCLCWAGEPPSKDGLGVAWIIARQQVVDGLRTKGEDVKPLGRAALHQRRSYDKSNAESILFDVVMELQTNNLLIADFGVCITNPEQRTRRP